MTPYERRVYRRLPNICTVTQLLEFLPYSRSTIYRWIHRGIYRSYWWGVWCIPKIDLLHSYPAGNSRRDIRAQIIEAMKAPSKYAKGIH